MCTYLQPPGAEKPVCSLDPSPAARVGVSTTSPFLCSALKVDPALCARCPTSHNCNSTPLTPTGEAQSTRHDARDSSTAEAYLSFGARGPGAAQGPMSHT